MDTEMSVDRVRFHILRPAVGLPGEETEVEADPIAELRERLLDLERRDHDRVVIRWPRRVPLDGAALQRLQDELFDRIVVELVG